MQMKSGVVEMTDGELIDRASAVPGVQRFGMLLLCARLGSHLIAIRGLEGQLYLTASSLPTEFAIILYHPCHDLNPTVGPR